MEAVILMGIQGSGKSTFFKERFYNTHVRINLDMLKTRHREELFLKTCLETQQRFVIDNTNCSKEDRCRYIPAARKARFKIAGYYFKSNIHECLARNAQRPPEQRIPDCGVRNAHGRLELPELNEGFDELYYVKIAADGNFDVEVWKNEI